MMATMRTARPPPPPPPPPPVATQVVHIKPQVHLMDAGKLMQPKAIPHDIKIIKEDAPDVNAGMAGGVPGGVAGGSMGGGSGGLGGGLGGAPPPAKPTAARIRPGGGLPAAVLGNEVPPGSPHLADHTRIRRT